MPESINRRRALQFLAAGAASAIFAGPTPAKENRIERLIRESRTIAHLPPRIDFISRALRGTRYRAGTLVGGPYEPEKFIVRDDAFDCVTYCETVLAAARAENRAEFETQLRNLRYHNGVVDWFERNHYFFEWCQHNVDNKMCRWLEVGGVVDIEKTVDSQKGLARRAFAMRVIPSAVFLARKSALQTGDVVGFVSRRADLDYFHCGLIAFARGRLLVRHASATHRRVLDERMDRFLAVNRVHYVTLLRPAEASARAIVKAD